MHSIDLKAMCSVYDFKNEFFIEEFDKTISRADLIKGKVRSRIEALIKDLDKNEVLIQELMK
jgi:DNA/RNA-binding domain of Phe-tRNA-synthetase-like protein